jgi:hypothetical protein
MNSNIKQKVLTNKLLTQILEQIDNPVEREKTLHAINGLLDEIQGKANGLLKSYQEKQNTKKTEDK